MIVKRVAVYGVIETNAYFYIDETTKHGFLLDPGAEAGKLLQIITDNHWIIEKILLTHGHFDHIGAAESISRKLNIPILAHRNGRDYLSSPKFNLSAVFGNEIILNSAQYFADDTEITLEANPQVKLRVLPTPGHTQDGVVYYDAAAGLAFVGDTIFRRSIGRTDIPGGDLAQLLKSIEQQIFTLPDDTILYSGHTPPTTVSEEKKHNLRF